MDLAFSKEEIAFREEVRAFFRDNVPPDTRKKMVEGRLRKYYEEVTLLAQTFVIDGETKVAGAIK